MLDVSGYLVCFSAGSGPMLTARSPLPLAGELRAGTGLFCPPRAKNKRKAEDNRHLNIPGLQLAPATASQSRPSAR